ncbi:MAG: CheR family methyltransferase [Gammaproteobacteria bacterium]
MVKERDFAFTDSDFVTIRHLVKDHTGISLSDAKKDMVYSRLSRRLRQLELDDFKSYSQLIIDGQGDELTHFTNAITTNLTSFFREEHHFNYLANTVLPDIIKNNGASRRLRIWSAGCSTGEEPYSIAIILKEILPRNQTWDAKILATDLDSNVVATAKSGVYSEERIKHISENRKKKWFRQGNQGSAGLVSVSIELKELITFKQLNLLHNWPMKGPFDVIFCRNVVIYFNKDTQKVLFDRYADLMETGNHLFIGHSESLFKVSDRFELLGQTIYRKIK